MYLCDVCHFHKKWKFTYLYWSIDLAKINKFSKNIKIMFNNFRWYCWKLELRLSLLILKFPFQFLSSWYFEVRNACLSHCFLLLLHNGSYIWGLLSSYDIQYDHSHFTNIKFSHYLNKKGVKYFCYLSLLFKISSLWISVTKPS